MTNFYSTPENEVVRLHGERVVAERYRHGDVQAVVGVELEDTVRGVLVHGVDRKVSDAYAVTATPTVYLIDRQGRIIGRAVGRRDWAGEAGRRLIAALLPPRTSR